MQGFGWDRRHIELGRGIVGTGKQMVDMMERQEKPDFPWQAVTLNGETVYVQNPEEMLFSKISALVNPGLDDEGSVREREIKWGVDIKILKTYLMVEKGMDAQQLDNYLAERWNVYTESERYGSVKQLAEQFDGAGNVQQLLTPVMEKMLGRPVTDLRADLISTVGNGSEALVDGLLAVNDKEGFVKGMRAVVDYRIGSPMTFEEAQRQAGGHYADLLQKSDEKLQKEEARAEKQKRLESQLAMLGAKQQYENGFEFSQTDNPQQLLEWATVNGYVMHGSTRIIKGELVPTKANDLIKESGNREAVYMTKNPLLSMFTAVTGGKDMGGRRNECFLAIDDGVVSYPREPKFYVGKPEEVAQEGYVYIFDKDTQVDEEVAGECLSYKPIRPLAVVKIKREDFRFEIVKIENSE